VQVTPHLVFRAGLERRRRSAPASIEAIWTPGAERTTERECADVGHGSLDGLQAAAWSGAGHRGEQPSGVGMPGFPEDRSDRRLFDLTPARLYCTRMADREDRATRKKCNCKSRDKLVQTCTPLTLFPRESRRGEKTPIPNCPGRTTKTPPATPLLAGIPTE